jgi:DNA-binding transcriptional LysR family regulator
VEIRQLEALVGIADHGTFSGAAHALGTVQSNISSRIARLEAELGAELVDRSGGVLTESGEVVVARARRVLSELASVAADVSELRADIRGQVMLGMIGTAGRWIVPLIFEAQRRAFPHVRLRIVEGANSTLGPQLASGVLDLAVLASPVVAPELALTGLFDEDLAVVADRRHPLARGASPVTLAQLADVEILLPMEGTPIRREIDEACEAAGVTLRPLIEMDGLRTLASLTFDGHGPAILPASLLSVHLRETFVALPIVGMPRRRVVLASRRFGFPPAPVRALASLLPEVVASARDVPTGVHVPHPALA